MKRFLASWAVLSFLVVSGHMPLTQAFDLSWTTSDAPQQGDRHPQPEQLADRCDKHGGSMYHAGGLPTDPVFQIDIVCKLACAAIVDLNAAIQPDVTQYPDAALYERTKPSPWRSLSRAPLLRPPFPA